MAKIIGYAPIRKVFTSIGLFGGVLLISTLAASVPGADEFARGLQLYQRDEFKGAIMAFEQAVGQAPKMAKYHHWLGKAYGRLAERSSWMRAVELAKRTQRALEKAVELDPDEPAALVDLLNYYEQAPSLLGGDQAKAKAKAKAKAIRRRLVTLKPEAAD